MTVGVERILRFRVGCVRYHTRLDARFKVIIETDNYCSEEINVRITSAYIYNTMCGMPGGVLVGYIIGKKNILKSDSASAGLRAAQV